MPGWESIVISLGLSGMDALKERKGRGGRDKQTRVVLGVRLMQVLAELTLDSPDIAQSRLLILEALEGLGEPKAIKAAYAVVKASADDMDDGDFESAL